MKRMIQRLAGQIPAYHKYYLQWKRKDNFLGCLDFLFKSQWYALPQIHDYQNEHFLKIFRYAYDHVPFYRSLYDQHRISPGQIKSLEDISRLPIINKTMLNEKIEQTRSDEYQRFSPIKNKTTGTTGVPLTVLIDKKLDTLAFSMSWRHLHWSGYKFHHKAAYIRYPFGFQEGKIQLDKLYEIDATGKILNLNTALMNDDRIKDICGILEKFQAEHLLSYPSWIQMIATYLDKHPQFRIRPRSIVVGAEKFTPEQRDLFDSVFQCPTFDMYGQWEYVNFACECEHHRMHMNFEMGYTEIIKDGAPCGPGETGEIVATSLHNHSMPLIRYATGDYGNIINESCPCGRHLDTLEILGSRNKTLIMTSKGVFNVLSRIPFMFKLDSEFKQMQFFQEDVNLLIVRIVKEGKYSDDEEKRILKMLDDYFLNSIQIRIEYVDQIQRTSAGKYNYVVSKVPIRL